MVSINFGKSCPTRPEGEVSNRIIPSLVSLQGRLTTKQNDFEQRRKVLSGEAVTDSMGIHTNILELAISSLDSTLHPGRCSYPNRVQKVAWSKTTSRLIFDPFHLVSDPKCMRRTQSSSRVTFDSIPAKSVGSFLAMAIKATMINDLFDHKRLGQ